MQNYFRRWLLPAGVDERVLPLLIGRALRAFADGYVAILLPAYLLALGLGTLAVGVLSTATLLGSALATLAVGAWGHRIAPRRLLLGAALLMLVTGLLFALQTSFWPLLLIAFVGTLNPSSGDVSVFLPLEHARLAEAGQGHVRTALFARYALLGALFAALGALASAVPDELVALAGIDRLSALRLMFAAYGALGGLVETRGILSGTARAAIFIGVLGGYTTFSTFGYESFQLIRAGQMMTALGSVALHVTLGLTAVWAGDAGVRAIWGR